MLASAILGRMENGAYDKTLERLYGAAAVPARVIAGNRPAFHVEITCQKAASGLVSKFSVSDIHTAAVSACAVAGDRPRVHFK